MDNISQVTLEARVVMDALTAPETIPDTRAVVKTSMFTNPILARLWERALSSWDSGSPIDATAVLEVPDPIVKGELTGCVAESGSVIGTVNNARALRWSAVRRLSISFATDLTRLASGLSDTDAVLTSARRFVDDVESCHSSRHSVRLVDAVAELGRQLEETRRTRASGAEPYISTGFTILDHYFRGGLRGGNVMTLAARPGVGKTAVILSMIRAALESGRKVRLYSLEMPAVEIAERIMYALGGLRPFNTRDGEVEEEPWRTALDTLKDWGLWIEDSINRIGDIISDATVHRQRGECDIVFMDHLQLIRTGDPRLDSSAYARTCEITHKIKGFALTTLTPVVLACQLSRDVARDKEKRDPDLQDLRDSGSIEEDSDKVVFLKRMSSSPASLKMIIGKNRQGGGAYESTFLFPNDTFSVFQETDAPSPEQAAEPYVEPEPEDKVEAGLRSLDMPIEF